MEKNRKISIRLKKTITLFLILVVVSTSLYSCKYFLYRDNQDVDLDLEDPICIEGNDCSNDELQTQDLSHEDTVIMISSTPTIPTPTPMATILTKFVVCEKETLNYHQGLDHKLNFYWITLNCDKRVEDCNITKELHFDYEYLYSEREYIQDFTNDWKSFLYIPYGADYYGPYTPYQYSGDSKKIKTIIPIYNATLAVYSEDNTKILIRGGTGEYYLVDEFGQKKTFETDYELSTYPSLSPDNNWIAFIGQSNRRPEECSRNSDFYTPLYPYLINTNESGEIIAIGSAPIDNGRCGFVIYDRPIVWNNDSSAIYFTNEYDEQEIICTIDINSYEKKCFFQHKFEKIYDYVLFDDKLLIEARVVPLEQDSRAGFITLGIDTNIYLLDTETNELRTITDTVVPEIDPIWIEDGSYILYSKDDYNFYHIYITDPYGSFHKQVTNSYADDYLNGMCPGY